MNNEILLAIAAASLTFVLFLLVGALLSLLLDDRVTGSGSPPRLKGLTRTFITLIITALLSLLLFWTNLRISGLAHWINGGASAGTTAIPTLDLDS